MASTTRKADQPKPAGGLAARLLTSTSEAERRLGDLLQRFEAIEPPTGSKLARLEQKLAGSADPRDRQLLQVLYEIAEDRGVGPPEPVEIEATLELAGRSRAVPVRLTMVAGGEATTYRVAEDGSDETPKIPRQEPKKAPSRRVRPKKAKAVPPKPPILDEASAQAAPAPPSEPDLAPIPEPAAAESPAVDELETTPDTEAALAEVAEAEDEAEDAAEPEIEVDAEERAELLKALMEGDPTETVAEAPASPVALTFSEIVAGDDEDEAAEDGFSALAGEPPSLLDEFEANAVAVDEPETVEESAPAPEETAPSAEIASAEPVAEQEFSIADCDIELVERVPRRIAFMALALPFKRVDGKVQFLAADQIESSTVELLTGLVDAEVEIVTIDRQELLARLSAVYGSEPAAEREAILEPGTQPKPGLLKRLFGRKAA